MASEMVNGAVLHYEERGSGPPLLLVHGMRLLPRARMVSLPGAAHMLHIDQPGAWVEAVIQITGHARSPAAGPSPHRQ